MCREVIPAEKLDKCFKKCDYDEDCSSLIPPDPEDVCLLDGGCSRTKSKKKQDYNNYKKGNKYDKEKDYVAKGDKYANKDDRRLQDDDNSGIESGASTIFKGTRRIAPRRRRKLYSHEMVG